MMASSLTELSAALFTAIVHSTWQGCLAALVFVILSRLLPSPQFRYRLAMLLFFGATLAFLVTFILALSTVTPPTRILPGDIHLSLIPYVALAWFAGAALIGVRFFSGWLWLQFVILRTSEAVPEPIQALFDDVRAAINVSRRVGVRASTLVRSPMVTGVLKPMVILPASMLSGIPSNVLTAVFVHELLHVRRFDHIAIFFQAIGETLLFYHPAVHWLSAEIRRSREYCCDDDAVRHLGDRYDYARALVSIEQNSTDPLGPVLLMNGGELMNRIELILSDNKKPRSARVHFFGMLAFVTTALLTYSLSYADLVQQNATENKGQDNVVSIAWLPPAVTQWSDIIEDAARRHDVPANTLALMLFLESHGDELATSSSGARGLMQIMPNTGRAIAEEFELVDFDVDQMYDPEINIDFGAWYLGQLIERFSDQPQDSQKLAISAYNAGPGRVDSYLSGSTTLPEETVAYRDALLHMLSEADDDHSQIFEQRKAKLRQHLPMLKPPVEGRLASSFGFGNPEKRLHKGVDIAAPMGTPVVSPASGRVTAVGEDERRGKYVTVRHLSGVESHYYHLNSVSLAAGTSVATGDRLGAVGNSGVSSGPHLHFEVREFGLPVSPSLYGLNFE